MDVAVHTIIPLGVYQYVRKYKKHLHVNINNKTFLKFWDQNDQNDIMCVRDACTFKFVRYDSLQQGKRMTAAAAAAVLLMLLAASCKIIFGWLES